MEPSDPVASDASDHRGTEVSTDRGPSPAGLHSAVRRLFEAPTLRELCEVVADEVPDIVGARSLTLVLDDVPTLGSTGRGHRVIPVGTTLPGAHLVVVHEEGDTATEWVPLMASLGGYAVDRLRSVERSEVDAIRLHQFDSMIDAELLELGLDDLLEALPRRIASVMGCEFARVFLADETRASLEEAGSFGLTSPSPSRANSAGLTGRVVAAGSGVVFDSLAELDVVGDLPGAVTTVAGVPLLSEGEVIGVLDVGAGEGRRFDAGDLALLERAARHISTAIAKGHALILERERRARSDILAVLGLILQLPKGPTGVASRVARMAVQRICDECHISIVDAAGEPLSIRATKGRSGVIVLHHPDEAPEHAGTQADPGRHVALVGDAITTITFSRHEPRRPFSPEELRLLDEITGRLDTTLALRLATHRLRRVAAELQRSLLPRVLPRVPGLDVAVAAWAPADPVQVGGDFYDLYDLGEGRWGAVVGDVSGKGVKAAAMTGIARHTARAASRHGLAPEMVLGWVHDAFMSERETVETFCTGIVGTLDTRGPVVRFEFAVGGHPLPILVPSGGSAQFIGAPGTALGLIHDVWFRGSAVDLRPGDLLLLYTDGVTDVPGKGALDDARLLALVDDLWARCADAAALVDALRDDLSRRYQGTGADDTVVLALHGLAV